MKKKIIVISTILLVLIGLAGNTHRILPASMDPCQTDMSHVDHLNE
jgi:hypothetical protein